MQIGPITADHPERHFWLARSAARSMQFSLSDAMRRGVLSSETYNDMVERCSACGNVPACLAWLAESGPGHAAAADHCAIGDTLDALARMLR